jgi:hypothetical protein
MNEQQLQRVLAQGLGRGVRFLRDTDATPYRSIIAAACVHNTAYDPQVEGSRAPYMLDVIRATGAPAFYRARVLAALETVTEYRDACQLFDFARLFALDGDAEARQMMYRKFARDDTEQRCTGAEEIIELDGLAGFLAVARHIGAAVRADPSLSEDSSLLRMARDLLGPREVDDALTQAGRDDATIVAYREAVAANAAAYESYRSQQPNLAAFGYDDLVAWIAAQGVRAAAPYLRRWGEGATVGDLARAAVDLPLQADAERLIAFLRVFAGRSYPLDPTPLLNLARHPNERVTAGAIMALERLTDWRIRALALDLLNDAAADGYRRGQALRLMARHVEPGDVTIVGTTLDAAKDAHADDFHALGAGALRVLQACPTPEAIPALLTLYESGPCSSCRERSVDLLLQLGSLPDHVLDEVPYDANLDLRAKGRALITERDRAGPT